MKYLAQRLHGLFGQDRLATSLRRNGWHWNLENPGRLCNHLLRALGELLISETINFETCCYEGEEFMSELRGACIIGQDKDVKLFYRFYNRASRAPRVR
jgi:ATP-dependent phosphofructokinase / diphosphate-dependent phosphofructokinase